MLRLLLEAHTVQNFNLKDESGAVVGGGLGVSSWPSSVDGVEVLGGEVIARGGAGRGG